MKIIDAHLHFWPGHGHFDELALEAGHENTAGHLKMVYQDLDISFGIVMGNRGLSPKEHEYPGFLRYCIGVDRGYLKDHSLTETYDLLEENLKRGECVGIKLYPGYNRTYITDREYEPVT